MTRPTGLEIEDERFLLSNTGVSDQHRLTSPEETVPDFVTKDNGSPKPENGKLRRGGGPKSKTGKMRSGQNRIFHGFYSKEALLPHESAEEYEQFVKDRLRYFKVTHRYEKDLVVRLADLQWKLQRLIAYESATAKRRAVTDHVEPEIINVLSDEEPILAVAPGRMAFLLDALTDVKEKLDKGLDALPYHRMAESQTVRLNVLNDIYSALRTLKRLSQTNDFQETDSGQVSIDDVLEHLSPLTMSIVDFTDPSDEPAGEISTTEVGKLVRMTEAVVVSIVVWIRKLQKLLPLARRRAELLEGTAEGLLGMPPEAEAKRLASYRTSLEKSIQAVMGEIEASRHLRKNRRQS